MSDSRDSMSRQRLRLTPEFPWWCTTGLQLDDAMTTIQIEAGDVVVLYTDGVSEALDLKNRYFGAGRLTRAINAAPGRVSSVGESILQSVRQHAAGRAQSDDIALLCIGRGRSDTP